MNLIDVQYEELPYITDPLKAIEPGAPVLHDNPVRLQERARARHGVAEHSILRSQWSNGDVEAGFKKAARVFEHTFRTPLGFHAYIEPHACTVRINDDGQTGFKAKQSALHIARPRPRFRISIRRKSKCISCPLAAISAARLPSSKCRFVIS